MTSSWPEVGSWVKKPLLFVINSVLLLRVIVKASEYLNPISVVDIFSKVLMSLKSVIVSVTIFSIMYV